jgi:hypothetical protein
VNWPAWLSHVGFHDRVDSSVVTNLSIWYTAAGWWILKILSHLLCECESFDTCMSGCVFVWMHDSEQWLVVGSDILTCICLVPHKIVPLFLLWPSCWPRGDKALCARTTYRQSPEINPFNFAILKLMKIKSATNNKLHAFLLGKILPWQWAWLYVIVTLYHTPSVPKYKHSSISVMYVWPFVLFKKFLKM